MSDDRDLKRRRYAEDPQYREKTLASNRKRYAEDDAFRERTLAARRQRYAEDPQYREQSKAGCRLYRQRKKVEQERLFGPPLPKKKPMSDAEWSLLRKYGLTQADYDFMAAAQNGLCAICERRPTKLCVDHCHATRRLRFLLCNKCNTGFGQFDEDPRVLRRALAYAELWQRIKAAGLAGRLVPEPTSRKRKDTGRPTGRSPAALSHCPVSQARSKRDSGRAVQCCPTSQCAASGTATGPRPSARRRRLRRPIHRASVATRI
jgi:Recombination endonuclease VII